MKKYSAVLFLSVFSCCLAVAVCYRSYATESSRYIFLIWNLFLAWLPYLFSLFLNRKSMLVNISILGFWLLFFPNAPYIITDLFHLTPKADIPFWFDTLLLFGSSFVGLLLGAFSMLNVYQFLKPFFHKHLIQLGMISVSILAAFGIYIGRYQRWNSWDIIDTPFTLLKDCLHILKHSTTEISFFCLLFGGFIYASYALLNGLSRNEEITS